MRGPDSNPEYGFELMASGVMALAGIGVLAHVEPAGALRLSTRTAANGAAVITSATCFPAIH